MVERMMALTMSFERVSSVSELKTTRRVDALNSGRYNLVT